MGTFKRPASMTPVVGSTFTILRGANVRIE
jgi:hypothetical protein